MMTLPPYPLPRQKRETDIKSGDGGTTYGPFDFKIFDQQDVRAFIRSDGDPEFRPATATIAKVNDLPFDDFTVTFAEAIPETTSYIVASTRLHERMIAVTRGGAISGQELEKELSKQGTVIEELRRDVDRGGSPIPGSPGQTLVFDQHGTVRPGADQSKIEAAEENAEAAIAAKDAAEAAQIAAENAAGANLANADSVAAAELANIPLLVNYVRTAGRLAPADGGGALYKRGDGNSPGGFFSGDGAGWELAEDVPSALMFGDPSTDISAIINLMIDYLEARGGGSGRIPAGRYYPASTIMMKSNVTIVAEPGAIFDTTNLGSPASANGLVRFLGSRDGGVPIAAALGRNDRTVTTTAAHGLAAGDLAYVFGQRNALSSDAGDDWRLGTQNSGPAYFAEFNAVASVESATAFTLSKGIVFPSYLPVGHSDADLNARASTTIHKVSPVRDAHWIGGTIDSKRTNNNFFRGEWAHGCTVEDVTIHASVFKGGMTLWRNCFECSTVRVRSITDPATVMTDPEHDDWNHHKICSCHDCDLIDCISEHSSQCWDITYFSGEGVNLYCGVYGFRSRGARYNAGTTHPGAFATDVIDGKYLDCVESGISLRSRAGLVLSNRLTGASRAQSPEVGISIYGGFACENLVENNVVDGFYYGVWIWDSSNPADGQFKKIGGQISKNTIIRCGTGIRRSVNGTNKYAGESALIISGNYLEQIGNKFVELSAYTQGAVIADNHFVGPLSSGGTAQWVDLLANSTKCFVVGNHFYNGISGDIGIRVLAVSDTTTFPNPQAQWAHELNPNYFHGWAGTEYSASLTYVKTPDPWRIGRPGILPVRDGVAAPTQIGGVGQIYIDTADGDLKIIFGDGTVKTIVTD